MTLKGKKKKKSEAASAGACDVTVCVDPATGLAIIKSAGRCPPGWKEEVKAAMRDKGVSFDETDE